MTVPIFYNNRTHKEIGPDKVDVPDAYFKVILDYRRPDIKAIGFICKRKFEFSIAPTCGTIT